MSHYNNDTNNINKFKFDGSLIKAFENIGLRPIGIYQPSNAAGVKWSDAYPDPEFRWSNTILEIKQDRYSFENYATMFGPTHIKDSETGEYLNLNTLDVDCQMVYNRLSIPIGNLTDSSSWDWVTDKLRDLVKAFLSNTG